MESDHRLIQWHGQPNSVIMSSEPSAGGSEEGDDHGTVSESAGVDHYLEAR